MQQAKRPVSRLLAGPYGHPYHPMLVALPVGSWSASLLFDIASHIASKAPFLAAGSEWLIGIGVAGAVLAGAVGFLDLAIIPFGTQAARTANAHMIINLMLTLAYAGNFLWRYKTAAAGAPVRADMIALSVACMAALLVSGYLGGKLTYRYGVRVAAEVTQARAYLTRDDEIDISHRAQRRSV
jgi:uncharacterized membrane protein